MRLLNTYRAVATLILALTALHGTIAPAVAQMARQSRICRSLLPVLNPREARLTVLSVQTVGSGDGVVVSYDVSIPDSSRIRSRRLICAFAKRKGSPEDLMLVSSDGRVLGVPRLTFLKRFYLRSRDAEVADEGLQLPPAELQRQKVE